MKSHAWEQRKLGDVLEFLKDGTHGTHPDADQGPLLLSAKNIKNGDVTWDDTDRKISQAEFDMIHSNFKLKKGDVLLTIVGSIGESAILKDPHEITFQRSVAFLRPNKTITSGFLYSEIQGEKFQTELNNRKSTSAQPGIYLGDLSEIPLDTPPNLKEQEEIGKFFSEINSLLTLHQRKWVEFFYPTYFRKFSFLNFWEFFNNRITNAWEQRKLGDVLEFLKDGTHGTHPDADQGPLLLSAKNIKNGDVTWDDTDRKISQAEFDMIHSNFKLKKGDVLLTIVGSIGESAILKDPHEITFQRSVAFLRPNKTITSGFLYSEIQGEKFQTELNNRKSTSAQPGIYLGDLSEIPLDTPPNLKEQEEIGKFFSEINSLLTLHQRQSVSSDLLGASLHL